MVRTTTAALLAIAATVPLSTAWPQFRREPGVVSTIADGQPQAPTSTAAAVSTIADGQPQAPKSTAHPVSTISDGQPQAPGPSAAAKKYKYVLSFSVDGLHSSDVGKYIALRPESTIARLLETGYEYSDAFTSAVSRFIPRRNQALNRHSHRIRSPELWLSLRAQALPLTACGMTTLGIEAFGRREAIALDHRELKASLFYLYLLLLTLRISDLLGYVQRCMMSHWTTTIP
jgi:hypothetical protein